MVQLSTTMPHRVEAVIEAEGWYAKAEVICMEAHVQLHSKSLKPFP